MTRVDRISFSPVPPFADQDWIGIACSRTNDFITERLLAGATARLEAAGVPKVVVIEVAGAFELIATTRMLFDRGARGVVALGAVIRGDTPHFEYICRAVTDGIAEIAASGAPVVFGVLTCDTVQQATDRAGGSLGNKGGEASEALLALLTAEARLGGTPRRLGRG